MVDALSRWPTGVWTDPVRPPGDGILWRGRRRPPLDPTLHMAPTLPLPGPLTDAAAMAFQCGRLSGEPEVVDASAERPMLREGMRGDGVKTLQLALIDLGATMTDATRDGSALPDGLFGLETLQLVQAFQRAARLDPDGVVGPETLAVLDQRLAALSEERARADLQNGDVLRSR